MSDETNHEAGAGNQPEADEVDAPPQEPANEPTRYHALRIWPVVLLLVGMWSLRIIPGLVPDKSMTVMMFQFMGPMLFACLVVLWWILLSRARLLERIVGFVGLVTIMVVSTSLAG